MGLPIDPLVCHCMKVRLSVLRAAIASGATTLDALGETTRAGLGCGTCRSELLGLIDEVVAAQNAESARVEPCSAPPSSPLPPPCS